VGGTYLCIAAPAVGQGFVEAAVRWSGGRIYHASTGAEAHALAPAPGGGGFYSNGCMQCLRAMGKVTNSITRCCGWLPAASSTGCVLLAASCWVASNALCAGSTGETVLRAFTAHMQAQRATRKAAPAGHKSGLCYWRRTMTSSSIEDRSTGAHMQAHGGGTGPK
jgi:hypothetical protein